MKISNGVNKKIIIPVIILGVIAVVAIIMFNKTNQTAETENAVNNTQNNNVVETAPVAPENKEATVKEFIMDSFYDDTGIWFSLKEISVSKGDIVRIKVTNIKGTHDFTLDEYGIKKMTPLNEEVVIEFTADKVGEFIYYCSVSGHRQKGQWGTLKVLDK